MTPTVLTLIYALNVAVWIVVYTRANRKQVYSSGRRSFENKSRFAVLSKIMFLAANGALLSSFWSDAGWFLRWPQSSGIEAVGCVLATFATIILVFAMRALGRNYSPYFDSYEPLRIITEGPYAYVRHPIYSANILVMLGLALMSGSFTILVLAMACNVEMVRAMIREEKFLASRFEGYAEYCLKTKRLIPFIY